MTLQTILEPEGVTYLETDRPFEEEPEECWKPDLSTPDKVSQGESKPSKDEEEPQSPLPFIDSEDKQIDSKEDAAKSSILNHNFYWVKCGIAAGFCMGTGAFCYAPKYAKYDLEGAGVLGPGMFVVFLIWRIVLLIRFKASNGVWVKR